jgi:hypothetical protein
MRQVPYSKADVVQKVKLPRKTGGQLQIVRGRAKDKVLNLAG